MKLATLNEEVHCLTLCAGAAQLSLEEPALSVKEAERLIKAVMLMLPDLPDPDSSFVHKVGKRVCWWVDGRCVGGVSSFGLLLTDGAPAGNRPFCDTY